MDEFYPTYTGKLQQGEATVRLTEVSVDDKELEALLDEAGGDEDAEAFALNLKPAATLRCAGGQGRPGWVEVCVYV